MIDEKNNYKYLTEDGAKIKRNELSIPFCWKSLSVFTKPATKALGNAANHSSLLRSGGIALKILFRRFSLV